MNHLKNGGRIGLPPYVAFQSAEAAESHERKLGAAWIVLAGIEQDRYLAELDARAARGEIKKVMDCTEDFDAADPCHRPDCAFCTDPRNRSAA